MPTSTAHRKRLTKHDLKEDKFLIFVYRTWDSVQARKTGILVAVAVVAGLVAVVATYQRSARSGAERAEQILFLAMNSYEAGQVEQAANGLTQFVDRFPRHPRRAVAFTALGNCQLALGRPADAEGRFKEAAKSAVKGSDLWVAATVGLGLAAEQQGAHAAALSYFQEAAGAASSKETAGDAMARAIRVKLRAGDREGARSLLDSAEKTYQGTRATRLLAEVRGEIEAEGR